ncbi:hypothetical protein RF11_07502 [Thelohanellus kitauei]|uniref:Uncharacterized protein n=1 Tax=Thelohanellus kitauei TaxID=669202 RepID=A0A0C2M3I3_THEKT|nr:hypothetical protein RF11_07502 [Thelohanellus kitauei]
MEFWKKAKTCLKIVFEKIQPEPYLINAISTIRSYSREYIQIEPCILFLSGLIVDDSSYDLLHEVYKFILKLPPYIPPWLIKTSCEFLIGFIINRPPNTDDDSILFVSIYKWLARLPISASFSSMNEKKFDGDKFDDIFLACDLLNRMLVLCHDNYEVRNLVRIMRDKHIVASDREPRVFKSVYEFLMNILLQVNCFNSGN